MTALAAGVAFAQPRITSANGFANIESINQAGASGAAALNAKAMGSGMKVGDDSMLHAGVSVNVGYDTNVMYQVSAAKKQAPVMFVSPHLELTNAERDGSIPQGAYYSLVGALSWREYLDSDVSEQRAVNPTLGASVQFSSDQKLSLALSDQFSRLQISPVGGPGPMINLDTNNASAGLKFSPGGGRLHGLLRFNNLLSMYEGYAKNASNDASEVMLDIGWSWFPRTALFLQLSQGYITYLESGSHPGSLPFRAFAGLRGLLTEKTGVNVAAGYANAFYSSGANPSGFGQVALLAELHYMLSLLSQAGLGYRHDVVDSPFIGQYYNVDAIYGMFRQMVAQRLVTYLFARYENRRFAGLASGASRTDNALNLSASINYFVRRSFYAGLSYGLVYNSTSLDYDATAAPQGGLDYAKHTILLGVGVVY